jgi:hypothetical protein
MKLSTLQAIVAAIISHPTTWLMLAIVVGFGEDFFDGVGREQVFAWRLLVGATWMGTVWLDVYDALCVDEEALLSQLP